MSEAERDLMAMRMIRGIYKDSDNVHGHTIIALCGILEKYLLPKLQIGKKLYEPKTHHETEIQEGSGGLHYQREINHAKPGPETTHSAGDQRQGSPEILE